MRLVFLGILVIALGGYIILQGMSYTTDRSVVRVGEFEASLEEKRAVPAWVGGLVVILGMGLVVMGGRRRE